MCQFVTQISENILILRFDIWKMNVKNLAWSFLFKVTLSVKMLSIQFYKDKGTYISVLIDFLNNCGKQSSKYSKSHWSNITLTYELYEGINLIFINRIQFTYKIWKKKKYKLPNLNVRVFQGPIFFKVYYLIMFCHIPQSYPASFSFTIIWNLLNCYYSPYILILSYTLFFFFVARNNSTSGENIIPFSVILYHVPFKPTKEKRQIFCTIWKSNFIFKVNQKWCIIHLGNTLFNKFKQIFVSLFKNLEPGRYGTVSHIYPVHYLLIPTVNFIICLSWVYIM